MMQALSRFVAASLLLIASGCVTRSSVPELPEKLVMGDGLLVARMYMPGAAGWSNAEIRINGRMYRASLRDGFLAMSLPAGEHTLDSLRVLADLVSYRQSEQEKNPLVPVRGVGVVRGGAPVYIPSYSGSSTVIHYKILPIERKFKIEPGKVTSLGLMVFVTDNKDKNKFYTLNFDNSTDVKHYLEANYPVLMQSLSDRAINLALGNYGNSDRLLAARRAIAIQEAASGKFIPSDGDSVIGYGDAGTLAWIKGLAKDKTLDIEVYETGTLSKIVDFEKDGDRTVFLTADAKLLSLDKNKRLTRTQLPNQWHTVSLKVLPKGDLIVTDNRMRLLTSTDKGNTWKTYDAAVQKTPTNSYDFTVTDSGYYVYARDGSAPVILHRRYGQTDYRVISAPSGAGGTLTENQAGLFLTSFGRDFHFLPAGRQEWQLRSKPTGSCKAITFEAEGRMLKTQCQDGMYESTDAGATWKKPSS